MQLEARRAQNQVSTGCLVPGETQHASQSGKTVPGSCLSTGLAGEVGREGRDST